MLHIHHEVLGSTNDAAREAASAWGRLCDADGHGNTASRTSASAAPTLVTAAEQTAGRGRNGRAWQSPRGGAWMSIAWPWRTTLVNGAAENALRALPLVVGLGVRDGLLHAIDTTPPPAADRRPAAPPALRIKWPNDLLLTHPDTGVDHKLAGILCERHHHFTQHPPTPRGAPIATHAAPEQRPTGSDEGGGSGHEPSRGRWGAPHTPTTASPTTPRTSSAPSAPPVLILGIGINVNNTIAPAGSCETAGAEAPTVASSALPAISLAKAIGRPLDLEAVIAAVAEAIERRVSRLQTQGLDAATLGELDAALAWRGRAVCVNHRYTDPPRATDQPKEPVPAPATKPATARAPSSNAGVGFCRLLGLDALGRVLIQYDNQPDPVAIDSGELRSAPDPTITT